MRVVWVRQILAFLVLCLFLLGYTSQALAFPPRTIEFEQIGDADNIPDQVVTTLTEDAHGFIWVGTPAGLVRYDGYRFRLFKNDLHTPSSIAGNFVRDTLAAERGHVWVATEPGGISIYDAQQDRFWQLQRSEAFSTISGMGQLTSLAGYGNAIWAGTTSGLFRVTWHGEAHFEIVKVDLLPSFQSVRALLLDEQGQLWVGSSDGLLVISEPLSVTTPEIVLDNHRVRSLYQIQNTSLSESTVVLAALEGHGVGRIAQTGSEYQFDVLEDVLEGETPYAFGQPSENELWVSSANGIVRLKIPSFMVVDELHHDPSNPYSLANNDTRAMLRDSAGQFWVAGYGGGVQRKHGGNNAVGSIRFSLSNPRSLTEPNISSVLELANRDIWIGTRGDGVNVFRRDKGVIEHYSPAERAEHGLANGWITAIAQRENGEVWLGANPNKLYRAQVTEGGDEFVEVTRAEGFTGSNVRVIRTDAADNVWVGTSDGVLVWDAETNQMEQLQTRDGDILTSSINAIEMTANGGVWIGSGTSGLYYVAPETQTLLPIAVFDNSGEQINDLSVLGLLEDSNQQVWLDSPQGLLKLTPQGDRRYVGENISAVFGNENAPFGANLLEDSEGRIWTTEYVYNPSSNEMWSLHKADDVDIGTAWYRSYSKTHDGILMFGGSRGLLFVDPEKFEHWSYQPPVVATELRIDGASASLGRIQNTLELDVTERSFALEFSALDLSEPMRNGYRYRLEGFDEDWIYADASRRVASYSNLWPGEYQLIVEGTNRHGQWSDQQLVVDIRKLPAFWQTPWFALLCATSLMALFYFTMKMRTDFMARQQKQLERVIEERTDALHAAQSDLIEREKMASLGALVAGVSHEINTPVGIAVTAASTLGEFTKKTVSKMEDGVLTRTDFKQYGEHVKDSTSLILNSLERARTLIASFKQVAVDQSSEEPRKFVVREFLNEVTHSLHPIYRKQKHSLVTECPATLEIETYPGALFQILSNLVTNSTIHAFGEEPGEMKITVEVKGKNVVLKYADNGKGMDEDVLKKAFDPFFTTRRGSGGSGLGLHIVYNFVTQVLKGDIKLNSKKDKGFEAVITFPANYRESS
ncbi:MULTISPECIES: two-component regulator propeller domain-containing protein [Gammaproteobacteria]|uniref:sensor histidine kinase n=1 Tax=Gammaproteobacteria TaxID=1236 RepID=UPI000DD0CAA6|nr:MULTISPECIES: two-component regulator propeller domain-containing protein [Gammaproteobacteria]RTE86508.1 hypothetical protein DQX04_08100 [Aliidiomarina sp. B3213]TCZ90937.1 hypothetical protein EYQ95_08945 [Lysobacter sp. N42]